MSFSLTLIDSYCLELILQQHGVSKILLYQCGDKRLCRKLIATTRKIKLVSKEKYITLKLPLLLPKFQYLRELTIKQEAKWINESAWCETLSALPTTLTSLYYDCDVTDTLFLRRLVNLSSLVLRRTCIMQEHINNLPPLVHHIGAKKISPTFQACFPTSVKSLEIYECLLVHQFKQLDGITHLWYEAIDNRQETAEVDDLNVFKLLPKSITRVHCNYIEMSTITDSDKVGDVLRFYSHPHESSATARAFVNTVIDRLPTNILNIENSDLAFEPCENNIELGNCFDFIERFEKLSHLPLPVYPPTLTSLEVVMGGSTHVSILQWEKHVCTRQSQDLKSSFKKVCLAMRVCRNNLMPGDNVPFALLPYGLRSLVIKAHVPIIMNRLTNLLPSSLEKLSLSGVTIGESYSFFSNLPPNLTSLYIYVHPTNKSPQPLIMEDDMKLLPQSLKNLSTQCFDYEQDALFLLPPKLERFLGRIESNSDNSPMEMRHLNALPKTLLYFCVCRHDHNELVNSRWCLVEYCMMVISCLPINCELWVQSDIVKQVQTFYSHKKKQLMIDGISFSGAVTNADIYSYSEEDTRHVRSECELKRERRRKFYK